MVLTVHAAPAAASAAAAGPPPACASGSISPGSGAEDDLRRRRNLHDQAGPAPAADMLARRSGTGCMGAEMAVSVVKKGSPRLAPEITSSRCARPLRLARLAGLRQYSPQAAPAPADAVPSAILMRRPRRSLLFSARIRLADPGFSPAISFQRAQRRHAGRPRRDRKEQMF